MTEAVNDDSAITTIAVCLPDTQAATQAALYLPDIVLRKAHQVLVYQKENDSIIRSVNNPDDECTKFDNILPFGIVNDSYSNNQIGDFEGKWINAYYTKEYGSDSDKQAWKDKVESWAQKIWDKARVSNKWSSIHSANMIHTKLRSAGVDINSDLDDIRTAFDIYMTDLVLTEHNRWVSEQLLAGFRPFYKDEWEEYKALPTEKEKEDNNPKKPEKAHANISSNATLREETPNSHKKDEQVTLALLEIIKLQRDTRS
jgi:hypothetical protein